ncbi:General alpha-glucoside permease [Madurella mycetomatis]|uniref:General alpha-glucoside permease n=1 Tax=Madurella mycetomatis TaxID=100816 RepID=A0A175W1Y1_9PEZI|nr:General alpha-glucoside permease [Madurella mycetomatis]KXX81104.1 General alpha-glucoside permease [Madurella mycetomatis]
MALKTLGITSVVAHLPETSLWANRKCLLICSVVAIANMQYGLDSAVLAGLQAMPGFLMVFAHPDPNLRGGYGIDPTFQQLIGSFLTLGAFLSSITAGAFSYFLGRRPGLWVACILTAIGAAVQINTTNWGVVYFGRIIIGVGNGFLVTFSNIYCAEVSPAHLRAVMVALFSVWVNIGSIIGAAANNATQTRLDKSSYQIPLGIQFVVPTLLAIGLFWVPESPRWLVNKGRHEEGRKALMRLRGNSMLREELELEWIEMVKGIEDDKKLARTTGALDMFRGSDLRRTMLCWAVSVMPTASGVWFLISYSTYFMIVSGVSVDDSFKFSIMKTCIGFIGVFLGMYLMRYVFGRRSTIMIGGLLQGMCLLAMALTATTQAGTELARNSVIAFVALFFFFYNAFVGDASHPVATELTSTRLRTWTVGSANSLGYLFAWLASFCSPYFINPDKLNWGARYGYIWAGSSFIISIFAFFFLPELKGRTLEEIDELFERRIPAWKFKTTKTKIADEARKEVEGRRERLQEAKEPAELVKETSASS